MHVEFPVSQTQETAQKKKESHGIFGPANYNWEEYVQESAGKKLISSRWNQGKYRPPTPISTIDNKSGKSSAHTQVGDTAI